MNASDYGYIVYIDESGDDGLRRIKPLDDGGASEWFVLSGVAISAKREQEVTQWVNELKSNFKNHQRPDIHFVHLNEAKKRYACRYLADLKARYFVVASNKKNMKGYNNPFADKIPSKNWFYCWMTRLLLERVTHFVKSKSIELGVPVQKLKIEYSNRRGISYSQMTAYYQWLKMKSSANNLFLPLGDLEWDVMDRDLLGSYNAKDRPGLQIADVVASAFFKAFDKHDTGGCDPQFAKLLSARMARVPDKPRGQVSGYASNLCRIFRGPG